MVESERHLNAIHAALTRDHDRAGIVDENIQALIACFEVLRQLADLLLRRQVGQQEFELMIAGLLLDLLHGPSRLFRVPGHQNQGRAELGQLYRGRLADPRRGSCNQAGLAIHGHSVNETDFHVSISQSSACIQRLHATGQDVLPLAPLRPTMRVETSFPSPGPTIVSKGRFNLSFSKEGPPWRHRE